jgi:hypothetical protein
VVWSLAWAHWFLSLNQDLVRHTAATLAVGQSADV